MPPIGKLILCALFFTNVHVNVSAVSKQQLVANSQSWHLRDDSSNQLQLTDDNPGFMKGEYHLDHPNYFEGDLNISQNEIEIYYLKNGRYRRAIKSDRDKLWLEGVIYYMLHKSIDPHTESIITQAIHELEHKTCLHFEFVSSVYLFDHIEFTGEGDNCLSNIGKIGGKQLVRLPDTAYGTIITCRTHGIVLHEILHVLGIWHEQSRPDRNKYVQVLESNIQTGRQRNFNTRSGEEVDSHGIVYDYGSIMHYNLNAFSSNGNPTLQIINMKEYIQQGQPAVGEIKRLSKRDIAQIRRVYNCPGSGIPGYLRIYIKIIHGVHKNQKYHLKVKAVDDNRQHTIVKSLNLQGMRNTSFWVEFEKIHSWQFFEMSIICTSDSGTENLTEPQVFSVSHGYHKNLRYCGNENCSMRVYFAYYLKNGNTGYQCKQNLTSNILCSSEQNNGILQIHFHLCDESLFNVSYISVFAYNINGDLKVIKSKYTGAEISESRTKERNQLFDFGLDTWIQFHIDIYYEDSNGLRRCTNTTVHYLYSYGSQTQVKQECDAGIICFDYNFFPLEHSSERDYFLHRYCVQAWTLILIECTIILLFLYY